MRRGSFDQARRTTRYLLALAWLATVLLAAAPAAARELHIEQFATSIAVLPDGSIETNESIRVRFVGAWQGLRRDIPVEYRTPEGFNFTLALEVVRVTDGAGTRLKYEESREHRSEKLAIFVPGATDATKTVFITYRVANALRFFADHDELYWNVTGNGWEVPVAAASAVITLPSRARGVRARAFTGVLGSRAGDATVRVNGTTVEVRRSAPLALYEGLTVVVGWDKGAVREPTWVAAALTFLRSNWGFGIPVIVGLLMWGRWYLRGRDPPLHAIAVRYQPPQGLAPAEAGTLLHNMLSMRDVTATIVDLAMRGYLSIVETPKAGGSPSDKPDHVFNVRNWDWTTLKVHEQHVLGAMFWSTDARAPGPRGSPGIADLRNAFDKTLPVIKTAILESLIAQGFYAQRPDRVQKRYFIAGAVMWGVITYGGAVMADTMGMSGTPFVLGGMLTFVVMAVFAWLMPVRTPLGSLALEELLGFQEFVRQVEAPRFQQLSKTSAMFEACLPYAIVFRAEAVWASAFDAIYVTPGTWYTGSAGQRFHAGDLASSFDQMSDSLNLSGSSSGSSSSSGFSSGSSGGGSGGGGGGGF